ncbi:MAG: exodeoxyribonuclease V subunit alpha [Smithellaceae bacterium]|nr:exodeoxyribonuclease V subunit alpha [Smithellaceae bacterium]
MDKLTPNTRHISFSRLDIHFAQFMSRLAGGADSAEIFAAAALASQAIGEGSICLNLEDVAGQRIIDKSASIDIALPDISRWLRILAGSSLVGRAGDFCPLILDHQRRLYLHRYHEYERCLIENIRRRLTHTDQDEPGSFLKGADPERVRDFLRSLYPGGADGSLTFQKVASLLAAHNRFSVISGSPGTGKTSAVIRIIAFLQFLAGDKPLCISLAAPTGKAAARLQEAVAGPDPAFPDVHQNGILPATTVHRLLGLGRRRSFLRPDQVDALTCDVLILDEASMVDLPLMARLISALPDSAGLVMLGDRNQLASVEAGAVFGDLHGAADDAFTPGAYDFFKGYLEEGDLKRILVRNGPAIQDSLVELKDSYRFPQGSPIGRLSQAVVEGDATGALRILKSDAAPDVSWDDLPESDRIIRHLRDYVVSRLRGYFDAIERGASREEVFQLFRMSGILCALRQGPYGSLLINQAIENILRKDGILKRSGVLYPGRPLMITRNDYSLGLFNGDVGLMLPDGKDPKGLSVYFPGYENEEGDCGVPLSILPENETIYAMTIHKSQGSEYDHVLVILPDLDSPVLTRELIYTAITRSRRTLSIWGREEAFRQAIERRILRTSGLREALWGE